MIKILIVDDQKVVRETLRLALEMQQDFQVVGSAEDGDDALMQVQLLQPDIVLLDVEMPGKGGLEAVTEIRSRFPTTRTVMMTSNDDVKSIRTALRNGAHGYMLKQQIDAGMMELIRSVSNGNMQFSPGILEKVLGPEILPLDELVPSERSNRTSPKPKDAVEETTTFTPAVSDHADWSNSAKEIIDIVPLAWTRGLFYCLLAFMSVALPWSFLFQMDEIGTARGRMELAGETVKKEADLEGSVTVTKVLVKKGDLVTKGQVLMELDSRPIRDQIQQNQVKLEGLLQRLNQLGALKNQLTIAVSTQQQQSQAQLLEKQAQIAQAQQSISVLKNTYNNQISEKSAQLDRATQTAIDRQNSATAQKQAQLDRIDQARQSIIDSTAAANAAQIRWRDARAEAERYDRLYRAGGVTEIKSREADSLAKEREQASIQAEANLKQAKLRDREQQNTYRKTIEQAQADIQQAQLQLKEQKNNVQRSISQLKSDFTQSELRLVEQQRGLQNLTQVGKLAVTKSEQQLKELHSQVTTLQVEIAQSKNLARTLTNQLDKYTVRANVAGTIFELPIAREGAVLQPKQLIAEIAPPADTKNALIFKGEIPASQSESLRTQGIGKDVKLKFDEFPFETYGVINGKVNWISPNSKVVTATAGNSTNYEVKIALDRTCVQHKNECLPFKSGQPATAEIVIRKRRIIDFIMDPFTKLKSS
ncbi:response regulator [Chamaesiphon sp. VAR_69_metabat_338]|uniref:response regulator n=1 Tax=Chamaesiphon sp. VAR_69_metabat_338 TaxID=2964704 RepID=UPI00286E49C0|nr:response regulator [Chamaesiphon sp. VAR_69_metabat_338]